MPYKDKASQSSYQIEWMRRRREAWLKENGPCKHCGSWENLEVDHIDPETKISHRVWSWSAQRRLAELKKCQPLCDECHKIKHQAKHGKEGTYSLGCRCQECRGAHAAYISDYRRRRNKTDPGFRKKFASVT